MNKDNHQLPICYTERDGTQRWLIFVDKILLLHREDGPAYTAYNGHEEWFLNGEKIPCRTQEEFDRIKKKLKAFL